MTRSILVLNAGSSSLKFSVFEEAGERLDLLQRGLVDGLLTAPTFAAFDGEGTPVEAAAPGDLHGHEGAIAFLLGWLRDGCLRGRALLAAGHRVVHGGVDHAAPARIDDEVLASLEAAIPLAPLHQPHHLAVIRALTQFRPGLPQVACFDTAFHRSQPRVAQQFALPRRLTEEGVRRYGFHGLSYEHIASVLPQHDPRGAAGRVIVAHLGNGASLCAMQGGRSVATTMSFTPLDGLPMGTRCGSLDPAVLLYLMNRHQLDAKALEHLLYHESGLLGVSGLSSDMRTLLASDDVHAAEAVELFVYRAGREIGSLAAALGGLDALVFTAGIGEHAAAVRARICEGAAWLGVELDAAANARHGPRISAPASRVSAWALPTDEERIIARHTLRVLG